MAVLPPVADKYLRHECFTDSGLAVFEQRWAAPYLRVIEAGSTADMADASNSKASAGGKVAIAPVEDQWQTGGRPVED